MCYASRVGHWIRRVTKQQSITATGKTTRACGRSPLAHARTRNRTTAADVIKSGIPSFCGIPKGWRQRSLQESLQSMSHGQSEQQKDSISMIKRVTLYYVLAEWKLCWRVVLAVSKLTFRAWNRDFFLKFVFRADVQIFSPVYCYQCYL